MKRIAMSLFLALGLAQGAQSAAADDDVILAVEGGHSGAMFAGERWGAPLLRQESLGWYGGAGLGTAVSDSVGLRFQGLLGQRGEKASAGVILVKPVLGLYLGAATEHLRQGNRWYAGPEAGFDLALAHIRFGWAIPTSGDRRDHRATISIGIAIPLNILEIAGLGGISGD